MTTRPAPGCTGKTPYASRHLAKARAKAHRPALHVYRCQSCGAWHVTHLAVNRQDEERRNRQRAAQRGHFAREEG